MTFFDPSNFSLNVLTIPMAMTGMAILGFGIWVLTVNRYDRLHRDFFILCSLLAGWLVIQAMGYSAVRLDEALPLTRLFWCPVLFIAPATFALNMSILGYKELRERLVPPLFILATIFLPTVVTNWFVGGNGVRFNRLAIVYQSGPLNLLYWAIFAASFFALLVLHYRRLKNPILPPRDRGIYRLIFAATIIGALGMSDWLQCVGAPIPPIGFIFVLVWISLFAYAIFRYRLFQLTITVAGPTIIEALPGALFVVNTGGEIVIVNPGAKTMTGQTGPALLGRDIRNFLPTSNETLKCALLNLESGGCSLDGLETTLKAGDGKETPISLSARVIRRPDGVPDGIIFIAVEITRLKEEMALVESQKAELVKVVDEMRRTQKLLIGRENRMVELKQELDKLKGENKPPAM
jgi:PAS domain S-box-containing protein